MSSPRRQSKPLNVPRQDSSSDEENVVIHTPERDYTLKREDERMVVESEGSLLQVTRKGHHVDVVLSRTPESESTMERHTSTTSGHKDKMKDMSRTSHMGEEDSVIEIHSPSSQGVISTTQSKRTFQPNPDSELRKARNKKKNAKRKARRRKAAEHHRDVEESLFSENPTSLRREESEGLLSDQSSESEVQEESQGWLSWAWNGVTSGAVFTAKAVGNGLLYAVKHPIVTTLSLVTAAPPALNALAMPSGKSPDKIGTEWWNEMSTWKKAHSIINSASSLAINAIMNAFFLPTAWEKFRKSITHAFDSPKDFIDNLFSIVLGLGGAVAAAAIAYAAFTWLWYGEISAAVPSAISFVVTLASRYIGVKNIFKRIHNLFSDDAKTQAEFAENLEHIKPEYLDELREKFEIILEEVFEACELYVTDVEPQPDEIDDLPLAANSAYIRYQDKLYYVNKANKECILLDKNDKQPIDLTEFDRATGINDFSQLIGRSKVLSLEELARIHQITGHEFKHFDSSLTDGEFDHISSKLVDALTELAKAHPDLVSETTTGEYVKKYAGLIFDLSFATILVGAPAYLTFMQKGFDGVNTISKLAGTDLTTIDVWARRAIGIVPGLATAMLYADSGTKIRTTCVELAKHLYENPKDLPFAVLALVANGFATSGPQNVAAGVAANKDNVIGVTPDDAFGTTLIVLNAIAGGVVNGNASLNKAFLANKSAMQLTEQDVARYLSKVNDHLVSHSTIDQLKLFNASVKKDKSSGERDLLRRVDSTFVV